MKGQTDRDVDSLVYAASACEQFNCATKKLGIRWKPPWVHKNSTNNIYVDCRCWKIYECCDMHRNGKHSVSVTCKMASCNQVYSLAKTDNCKCVGYYDLATARK